MSEESENKEIKTEAVNSSSHENEGKKEDPKIFKCHICNLHSRYEYFGTRPLERNKESNENTLKSASSSSSSALNNKKENIILLEKCFVCDDPFTQRKFKNYLILGSKCSSCDKMVCAGNDCSIFYYTKRFCIKCSQQYLTSDTYANEFPKELKAELAKSLSESRSDANT